MTATLGLTVAGIEPGSMFGGKYRIEKVIGTGGMGVILAATHTDLEQRVAIKLLTSDAAADPERVGRFSREAKAAARIQSEHVVRILDYGTHTSGAPFIVMEHLEGADLSVAVKTRGGLPIEEAIDYALQACEGVAEAHHTGIIHRDLKPANLFLTRKKDGTPIVKVLDFGASKLTAECSLASSDAAKTHASALIGSPRYMAPEQLKAAHEIDARADVYAMGATLWELLAGEPVFKAESISRIFTKILWDAPPSITQFRDDVPPELEAVLTRSLAKRPEDRYQSVKELVAALAPFAPARSKTLIEQVARIGRVLSVAPPGGAPSSSTSRAAAPASSPMRARAPSAPGVAERAGAPTIPAPASQGAKLATPAPGSVAAPGGAGARPEPPPAGEASMSTMSVLRAARADTSQRTTTLVGFAALVAVVAVGVFFLVLKPRMTASAAPHPSATQAVVPSAGDVPSVPPPTSTAAGEATAPPPPDGTAATGATPAPTAPTHVAASGTHHGHVHGGTHAASATAATGGGATSAPTPPATAPATTSTTPAPFSEFGNRK